MRRIASCGNSGNVRLPEAQKYGMIENESVLAEEDEAMKRVCAILALLLAMCVMLAGCLPIVVEDTEPVIVRQGDV